uniref:Protein sleepless n=1 Tax=Anopheles culicifacies TaxID=139723 RepID=A0A182M791_9DIPT
MVLSVSLPRPPTFTVYGIDCFKCVSMNGANKACDDPFHNNYSAAILESPCMGGRKGRDGLFPATSCIKIAGYYDDTGETITVRGCALDSGTLTTDTEIIRMSHCGRFYYDDRYVHGCLQSCNDADACNDAPRGSSTLWLIVLAVIGSLLGSATLQPSGWLRIVNGS